MNTRVRSDERDKRWVTIYDDEAVKLMSSWTGGQNDPLYAISSSGGGNYAWVIQDAVANLDSDIAKVKKLGKGKFQLGNGTFTKAEIDELHIIHDALVMALEDPESYSTEIEEGHRTRETVRALPAGQRTYTIKISGGRNAGEYEGESTLATTVKKAKAEFLPHLGPHETLKVVHFDRDGERTHVDVVIHSPPLGGPPPMHEHPYPPSRRPLPRRR